MNEECGEIRIPTRLIEEIEERIGATEFESVEEYVTFVLEEVIKDVDEEEPEEVFSEEDEAKVKERLRALGYLD
ncbi:MAG: CopG family transcriptional regulator [Deltaproteobacteria bacterium]|nr:MAG: CopG family transcriptional regulator [Deltaproteobacteria bacterium]